MEKEQSQWKLTRIFKANAQAYLDRKRIIANEGGTTSSKTISILQLLDQIARNSKRNLLISVISETMPHLKRGCIRDFQNILGEQFDVRRWNKTDFIYSYDKAAIEFLSADQPGKVRGPRRDIAFINECNNVQYDIFRQVDIRTRICTFLDWNPVAEFWAHENGIISDPQNAYIHSTYLDAKWVLPPEVVANIEAQRDKDPNWWSVYGLGLVGKVEGLVYPYFEQVDQFPDPASGRMFYGLDFGFSNDPTVLTRNLIQGTFKDGGYLDGARLYSQELIYETGMTNNQIAARMEELGVRKHYDEIFADSAEPKSIQEVYDFGFNIKPCPKGADSVEFGHQRVRQLKQHWTKDSLRCIKEQRNFRYIADKNGKLTQKTTHNWSHGMDSRRYGVVGALSSIPGHIDPQPADKSEIAFRGVRKKEF